MSTDKLTWENTDPPVGDDQIRTVEAHFGIKLPDDYIALAKKYHGGHSRTSDFSYLDERQRRCAGCLGALLSLNSTTNYENIWKLNELPPEDLPNGLFIFGVDGGGGYLAFDYRQNKDHPTVVYWISDYHSADIVFPLANTFTEFIDMLYRPADI